ncbi:uncharacterized protein PRCAT00002045001 [Priceomyces carsonii]|uniref:uncharacterized protein n=1 Tax=Priceomyces carsonii TaxID=28549 RepID=UPI002EDB1191|nr:unnamed protein product [Priceomyces carsonii]
MSAISGACLVAKVSGMIHIREDATPLVLEWRAIDQLKTILIPLRSLNKLQASKETSPKIMLNVIYKAEDGENKELRLTFTNRPTMNNIKESLQTIVARLKTVIKDSPAPGTPGGDNSGSNSTPSATPVPGSADSSASNPLSFANQESLSDSSLLKNHQLQQKLLLEDRNLRNIFTLSVIKFKLSPTIFWSTRTNQLRTYALTISQHRGPYNVLSTIKPVASSDNQVNVNVTRNTINEIFDTYPIVKKAFNELVPHKFQEGEFWSRFFNSKLFRRLRGDKIKNSDRGDVMLDKYLYIDPNFREDGPGEDINSKDDVDNEREPSVSKIIDVQGNEEDHCETLGNMPDITMRYTEESVKQNPLLSSTARGSKQSSAPQENEMIILMKNMNNLSSKMVQMNQPSVIKSAKKSDTNGEPDQLSIEETNELQEELSLHDLNEVQDLKFIKLNINTNAQSHHSNADEEESFSSEAMSNFFKKSLIEPNGDNGIDLTGTYLTKVDDIDKSAAEVTSLTKQNARTFRLVNKINTNENNILSRNNVQDIVTFNITIMEFLSHFWKLYLNGQNPGQLKKLFASLKSCKSGLDTLKQNITKGFDDNPLVRNNPKVRDKLVKDLQNCVKPMEEGLSRAFEVYIEVVRLARELSNTKNNNGKRPIDN